MGRKIRCEVTTIEQVQGYVARHFNISVADLRNPVKSQENAIPRRIAMFFAKKLPKGNSNEGYSYAEIAEAFGIRATNKGFVAREFQKVQGALDTKLGQKTEAQINIMADVWKLSLRTGIDIEL